MDGPETEEEYLKKLTTLAGLCLTASLLVTPAMAGDGERCKSVNGHGLWSLIPTSAGEPLGRVAGPTTGDLKAVVTAYLTGLTPTGPGVFNATSVEVWVLSPVDMLIFSGNATFTAIPDTPGHVTDALTLNVIGGTGAYTGASGTLNVTGTGYNLLSPAAGPGSTYFDIRYRGNICRAK